MPTNVLKITTRGPGLHEITDEVVRAVQDTNILDGICVLFVQHTSASLIIQENADPTVQRDLERFLNRLVQEKDPIFTHIFEGDDDMPAHVKSVLTHTSITIPVMNGAPALGSWQGIFLWEHRHSGRTRNVVCVVR